MIARDINLVDDYRKLSIPKEKKFFTGLDGIVNGMHGFFYKHFLLSFVLRKKANLILAKSFELRDLNDDEIETKIYEYRKAVRFGKAKYVLEDAVALIVEISARVLGMRPYDVQIMGVLAQQKNFLIEMKPGEGKTITAAIWAVIAAWSGKPCHIVTSNDYLASRDAMSLKDFYQRCDLNVGFVVGGFNEEQRRDAYKNDIVYATSKELLADFLRDSMKSQQSDFDSYLISKLHLKKHDTNKVMRGLGIAIVDEADSVLADEAITPLIISITSDNDMLKEVTLLAKQIVDTLEKGVDYSVDLKFREIDLTEAFEEKMQHRYKLLPPIFKLKHRREFLIKQALMAREFYHNHSEYIIKDGKIVIVDEKTGRSMEGRSWSAGLHQAIEAKEGLELSDPTVIHTKMSFQRFFRLYDSLSGMSGTLQKLENELWHIYKLPTIKIPKRIKNIYELKKPLIYATKEEKFQAVIDEIIKVHETKRPILVGTKDIKESEELSLALKKYNVESTVLNALYDEEEAAIVYEAGYYGSITIATNMAGRGTDIKIDDEIEQLGGLHVIATQKFNSIRVDLQLYGRTSRQGQKGSVQPIFSLEDELWNNLSNKWIMEKLKENINNRLGYEAAMLLYKYMQNKIEKFSSTSRKRNLQKDFSYIEMFSFSNVD